MVNRSPDIARRVVITSVGVISPLGTTWDEFSGALQSGKSGVLALVERRFPEAIPPYAAECRHFSGGIDDFGPLEKAKSKAIRKGLKLMCRETQMGVAAAQIALAGAQWEQTELDPAGTGVVFGSDYMLTMPEDYAVGVHNCETPEGRFDYPQWGQSGLAGMNPLWLLKYLPNMPASHIAIFNDFRGPNNSLTLRESAGLAAIAEAAHTIRRGHADRMLAGATGTRLHPMKTIHAVQQEDLADFGLEPESASRPFDAERTGCVLGEGSAALALESWESAESRGAKFWGEVIGAGRSNVASSTLEGRPARALANAIKAALESAQISPAEIGHYNAHGLGTSQGDLAEAEALREVLGETAREIPTLAIKSRFGNLGAASGIVELAASLLAFERRDLPKAINWDAPDPQCGLRPGQTGDSPGEIVLKASVTPQGQANALVVRAVN